MARMGHDSERASLIYLHSTAEHQRVLADAAGATARAELAKFKRQATNPLGTRRARTAVRLLGLVNDLRPDRDSNAGPTADRGRWPGLADLPGRRSAGWRSCP